MTTWYGIDDEVFATSYSGVFNLSGYRWPVSCDMWLEPHQLHTRVTAWNLVR